MYTFEAYLAEKRKLKQRKMAEKSTNRESPIEPTKKIVRIRDALSIEERYKQTWKQIYQCSQCHLKDLANQETRKPD